MAASGSSKRKRGRLGRPPGRPPAKPLKVEVSISPIRTEAKASVGKADGFPIVGIGASAGGLEAFTRLLRRLPRDTGMAFVLVQHLDPHHESMLPEILSRETKMPVHEVENGMKAAPNQVFVIPPNASMQLTDGSFSLAERTKGRTPPLPIDDFLTSLAGVRKSGAIGVVLSGNASDGTLGLVAIRREGGITFAQDDTAQFQGMPHAAIASGSVDFVLPPEGIAAELSRIAKHPHLRDSKEPEGNRVEAEALRKIFGLVRNATGVDFSYYRQTTIQRRLSRRMAVNNTPNTREYLRFLRRNSGEIASLFDDFLVTVTSFFRDPKTFEFLEKKVCRPLFKGRTREQPLRVWVPGCATGEEAYSLAICLTECQGAGEAVPIQVFATDVSEAAVEFARAGVYQERALQNVSPDRLRRFFVKVDGRYQIVKRIRDVCVFARHNVATDPPFSHLDLLSCRNLLIYLEPALQKRIFPLFHHALKPSGFLLLGPAESAGAFLDLFTPLDKKHRVFAKRVSSVKLPLELGSRRFGEPTRLSTMKPPARGEDPEGHPVDLQKETDRLLLSKYSPAGVVIDSNLDVVQFRGRTGGILEAPAGAATLNVLAMAREGLLPDLRAAVHRARSRNARVRKEGIQIRSDHGEGRINLEVLPLRSQGPAGRHYLILFESVEDKRPARKDEKRSGKRPGKSRRRSGSIDEAGRLSKELVATKESLQAIIEEHESTNEELQSANEEILSANEELQSTNEELDTAKEELQSANEELTTLNEELQNRNLQLSRVNDDLINLLHSGQIPIVMLGLEGRIRRFTPAAERLLNLTLADVGRPIQAIRPNFDAPDLALLVLKTIDTITAAEHEVCDRDGHWHLLRITPYRTLDNRIDGAVLSFLDINAQKKASLVSEEARAYAEAIVETVPQALLVLGDAARVRVANRAFYRMFQTSPGTTEGRTLFELEGGQWDVPELRAALEQGIPLNAFEVRGDFEKIGPRVLAVNARRASIGSPEGANTFLAIEDITERRAARMQLESSEAQYRDVFESPIQGALVLDAETGEIVDVNRYLTRFLGLDPLDFIGKSLRDLPFVSGSEDLLRQILEPAGPQAAPFVNDVAFTNRTGQTVLMEASRKVFLPGEKTQLNLRDVTEQRRLELELRHVQKMESIGRLAGGMAHDFNNILGIISAYAETLKRADPAKIQESARAIEKTVQRGAGVVRQLLTFARKEEAAFSVVNVNDVIRESSLMVQETFPKNVRITLDLDAGVVDIMADSNQLHQALLNLFVNARDAMPEGGALTLKTRKVDQSTVRGRFPEASALNYLEVRVADTGVGMDEITRGRAFEPFFTTRGQGAGSGLGLAVVYGVVTSHRGFIDLLSEQGKGTEFRLYFPSLTSKSRLTGKKARKPSALARGGGETVLFVEDEQMLLDSVRDLLEEEGYSILAASSAEDAVRLYAENHRNIALLITDLELPGQSGWQAFLKIQEINPEIRAIVVSGYLDPQSRARMIEGGARGFLRKPYTLDDLLRAMRDVLDGAQKSPEPAPS